MDLTNLHSFFSGSAVLVNRGADEVEATVVVLGLVNLYELLSFAIIHGFLVFFFFVAR